MRGVGDHHVRDPHQQVVAAHYGAAVGASGLRELHWVAGLSDAAQRALNLAGAVDVEDPHGGATDAAGLCRGDAVHGVLDHALDSVAACGSCGGCYIHGLAAAGGHDPAHRGHAHREGVVHGHAGGDLMRVEKPFHLFVLVRLVGCGNEAYALGEGLPVECLGADEDDVDVGVGRLRQARALHHLGHAVLAAEHRDADGEAAAGAGGGKRG